LKIRRIKNKMAILKIKDIIKMTNQERESKINELRIELLKASVPNKQNTKINPQLIKRTIAKLLTLNRLNKKSKENKE